MAKNKDIQEKEMTPEEAKAYRANLYKPQEKVLREDQKREAFRIWWASNKKKYGQSKKMEQALWLHIKTMGLDNPLDFEKGVSNFGFKKS